MQTPWICISVIWGHTVVNSKKHQKETNTPAHVFLLSCSMLNPFLLLWVGVGVRGIWHNSFLTMPMVYHIHNEEKWIIQMQTSIQIQQKNTHNLSTGLNRMAYRQYRIHTTFSHTVKKEWSLAAHDIPQHYTYGHGDAGGLNIGRYHNGKTTVLWLKQCSTNTLTNIQKHLTVETSAEGEKKKNKLKNTSTETYIEKELQRTGNKLFGTEIFFSLVNQNFKETDLKLEKKWWNNLSIFSLCKSVKHWVTGTSQTVGM